MSSTPDDLLDQAIRHQVGVQKLIAGDANALDRDLVSAHAEIGTAVLDNAAAVSDIDSRRFAELVAAITAILAAAHAAIDADATARLLDFARYEATFQRRMIERVTKLELVAPDLAEVVRAVRETPVQGWPVRELLDRLKLDDVARVLADLRASVMRRDDVETIIRSLRDPLQVTRRHLANVIRTIFNHGANVARAAVVDANPTLFSGAQWHATLDERTCLVCAGLDGEVFDLAQLPLAEGPPAHPSCRCFLVPVMGSRRSGATPVRYAAWLRRQSAKVQDEALGPTRGRLFRQGRVTIDRFTDARGHILTLDQLRKRDAA